MAAFPSSSAAPSSKVRYVLQEFDALIAGRALMAMRGRSPARPEDYWPNHKLRRERREELYLCFRSMVALSMSNKSEMARHIGVNRKTIDNWIKRYKMDMWHDENRMNELLRIARQAEAELPVEVLPPPIESSIEITA